jgi:hypothetical protein
VGLVLEPHSIQAVRTVLWTLRVSPYIGSTECYEDIFLSCLEIVFPKLSCIMISFYTRVLNVLWVCFIAFSKSREGLNIFIHTVLFVRRKHRCITKEN